MAVGLVAENARGRVAQRRGALVAACHGQQTSLDAVVMRLVASSLAMALAAFA